jgi:DNA-binding NtrC family response regulator
MTENVRNAPTSGAPADAAAAAATPRGASARGASARDRAKDQVIAHFEREYLTRLVGRAGGNMSKAARLASIDRTTLYRLMDKHSFQRGDLQGNNS